MLQVDKTRRAQAQEYLDYAHEIQKIECKCCQGMGGPSFQPCGNCGGSGFVTGENYRNFPVERMADYWNARALVAECEVDELRGKLVEFNPPMDTAYSLYIQEATGPLLAAPISISSCLEVIRKRCEEIRAFTHNIVCVIKRGDTNVLTLLPNGRWIS